MVLSRRPTPPCRAFAHHGARHMSPRVRSVVVMRLLRWAPLPRGRSGPSASRVVAEEIVRLVATNVPLVFF